MYIFGTVGKVKQKPNANSTLGIKAEGLTSVTSILLLFISIVVVYRGKIIKIVSSKKYRLLVTYYELSVCFLRN